MKKMNINIFTVPEDHPRLFINKKVLTEIKSRTERGLNKSAWERILQMSKLNVIGEKIIPGIIHRDNDIGMLLLKIQCKALVSIINNDGKMAVEAVSSMKYFLENENYPENEDHTRQLGHTIFTTAVVYDWCYDFISQDEKIYYVNQIKKLAGKMSIGFPPINESSVTSHSSEAQLMKDLLSAGVALYNEDKEIYNTCIKRFIEEYIPARKFFYPSGMHHQGESYGAYRFVYEMISTWLFDRIGIKNILGEEQGKVPYSWLYARRPDGQLMKDGDSFQASCLESGSYWPFVLTVLLTATYYNDPYINSEFLRQQFDVTTAIDIWTILFYDPDMPKADFCQLPLTCYFGEPMGMMIARTGWNMGVESNSAVVQMKVGATHFNNHQHAEAGSFQIYYKGALALDSGIYQGKFSNYGDQHHINYNIRTIAHNCMLVYDPNETFMFYGKEILNDGGQRLPNNAAEARNLEEMLEKGYKTGKVAAHGMEPDTLSPEYSYIKGDIAEAYTCKVEKYTRSMVFLNFNNKEIPGALIVFDDITSLNPEFKKSWLLHSEEEPNIENNLTTITNTSNSFNGKLTTTTFYPKPDNLVISKVGGKGKEFMVGEKNMINAPSLENHSEEPGAWRIEISPKSPEKHDLFLNIMQISDCKSESEQLKAEMIETDKLIGVSIADRVVIFSKNHVVLSEKLTIRLEGTQQNIKCLVTDLKSGCWMVKKSNETSEREFTAKEGEGLIYFDGEPGEYTLSYISSH